MLNFLLALAFPKILCLKLECSVKLNKAFTEKALEIYKAIQQNYFDYRLTFIMESLF